MKLECIFSQTKLKPVFSQIHKLSLQNQVLKTNFFLNVILYENKKFTKTNFYYNYIMKEDNLNTFKNYQSHATYQSRTTLPDLRQSFQNTQEYTRPEIMRVHQKLDQMLETLEKFTPSLVKKEIQNDSQLETQLLPPQYGTQRYEVKPPELLN